MRVVLDTNVLLRAAMKESSTPARLVRSVARHATLLRSDATRDELLGVGTPENISIVVPPFVHFLGTLLIQAERVSITHAISVCRDPKDNKFLELALCGRVDLLITGDRDLLELGESFGFRIVTPQTFLMAWHPSGNNVPGS
ncbi:MAG: putative toxin-antitoxin system toxin component, PIN family [Magnetococcales bacterium]|nr:putative toxin-antitoxin system toxin component, PIN family [Magnetococcales bacterium]